MLFNIQIGTWFQVELCGGGLFLKIPLVGQGFFGIGGWCWDR